MKKIALVIALAIASLNTAQAQNDLPAAEPLRFLIGMGVTAGGDKLVHAEYEDGDTVNIKAGGTIVFTGGVDYRISPQFSVQGTLNYHVDQANASNGKIKFVRFPVEVLGYYHLNQQWRVGGGLRFINSAKLSASGAAGSINEEFKGTVSPLIEAEFLMGPHLGVKMRLVSEKFEHKPSGEKVSGNHFGAFMNYYF